MLFNRRTNPLALACVIVLSASSLSVAQRPVGQRQLNQQQPGQRVNGPRVADAQPRRQVQGPVPREQLGPWGQIPPKLQEHTDKVLNFWEFHSSKIERYRCEFQRWEYDQTFDPKKFQTYSKGRIMYAKPDKGLFEVSELHQGRKVEGRVGYTKQSNTELEKWICDGKTIFAFDHRNKRLNEQPIPPDVQGKQIVEGPLPFFFGAKAAQIKARYWVRLNPEVRDKFVVQAIPKFQKDAANFQRIDIIIPDDEQFLPKAILMFHPGGARTTFEFAKRETNWRDNPLDPLKLFHREFFNPKTPAGWVRVKQPLAQNATPPPRQRPVALAPQTPRVSRAPR